MTMWSLSQLPLEIKQMIVHHAVQLDLACCNTKSSKTLHACRETSVDIFYNGIASSGSCLKTLSQLDSSFFALCQPVLWRVLDLQKLSTSQLRELERSRAICERSNNRHIRKIKTQVLTFKKSWYEPTSTCFKPNNAPPGLNRLRCIVNILREIYIVNQVQELELELCFLCPLIDVYKHTDCHPLTQDFLATLSRFENVKFLSIVSKAPLDLSERLVIHIIQNMRTLSSFSARNVGYGTTFAHREYLGVSSINSDQRQTDRSGGEEATQREGNEVPEDSQTSLAQHLSTVESLKTLRMYDSFCVDKLWSELEWKSRLSEIIITECTNFSSTALTRFLSQFQNSLQRVEYWPLKTSDLAQAHLSSSNAGEPLGWSLMTTSFCKITSLKLAGINLTDFCLDLFQDCPSLTKAMINSPNIRAETMGRLVKKWKTLKQLECRIRGGPGSLDLIVYCSIKGIDLDESFY